MFFVCLFEKIVQYLCIDGHKLYIWKIFRNEDLKMDFSVI